MALLTFLVLTTIAVTVAVIRYLENIAKNRLPKGVRPLPGPKGMPTHHYTTRLV